MNAPKADLRTAANCIRWTLFMVAARDEPMTTRHAKRMARPRGAVTSEEFDTVLGELREEGEVRYFRDPNGVGRPALYIHPAVRYEVVANEEGLLEPLPTPVVNRLMPSYESFKEEKWDPQPTLPVGDDEEPAGEPRPALIAPSSAPGIEAEWDSEPGAITATGEPSYHAPEPEQVPEPSGESTITVVPSDPDADPEADEAPTAAPAATAEPADDLPARTANAYTILRSLAAKSVKERKYGASEDELVWVLKQKGYSTSEAETHVSNLTGGAPEAFMAGGLWMTLPNGPHNKTEQTRYVPRSDSQARDRVTAEFEVQRARQAPLSVPSVP